MILELGLLKCYIKVFTATTLNCSKMTVSLFLKIQYLRSGTDVSRSAAAATTATSATAITFAIGVEIRAAISGICSKRLVFSQCSQE
jgi:hypothetical protein